MGTGRIHQAAQLWTMRLPLCSSGSGLPAGAARPLPCQGLLLTFTGHTVQAVQGVGVAAGT